MLVAPGCVLLDRYRVLRQLRREEPADVLVAEDTRTGRGVAVKLLGAAFMIDDVHPAFIEQDANANKRRKAVARLRLEARVSAGISGDHLLPALDAGEDEKHGPVLIFELREGETLLDRLKRAGPMPLGELHPLIEQALRGLVDLHAADVVHRSLQPSNLLIETRPGQRERVTILNLGCCRPPAALRAGDPTEMGETVGGFPFMPPEQLGRAKTVDPRADIYACATTIFQALSGQLPYAARNILVMVDMKAKSDARRLSAVLPGPIDPALDDFLSRGLARDPAGRFDSAAAALAAWQQLAR